MSGQVHIVGAGLAGLATAVRLAEDGRQVTLYEAAPQAGGRARSYHDKQLDCLIDNGNHLLLSANWAALSFLKTIDSRDALIELKPARLPFYDLQSGASWLVKPGLAMPFKAADRPPGTSAGDFLSLGLALPGQKTVAQAIKGRGAAWKNFWQPMTVAALNTQPEEASAKLLACIVRETFLKGESHCRPLIAREGLGPAFIDPALAFLKKRAATINLGWRLKALQRQHGRATQLSFDKADIAIGEDDRVILALPPWNLSEFLPELALPFEPRPIVNAHIKLDQTVTLPHGLPLLGLIGGTAEWIFQRGPILSLTVSAAEALLEEPKADLTQRLWQDTAKALGLPPTPQPPIRLLVEKRATFAATPEVERHRPGPGALGSKLLLAGDWTATGLPSTIEGAIRSGYAAAKVVTSR